MGISAGTVASIAGRESVAWATADLSRSIRTVLALAVASPFVLAALGMGTVMEDWIKTAASALVLPALGGLALFLWKLWLTPYRLINGRTASALSEITAELDRRTVSPERVEALEDNVTKALDRAVSAERNASDTHYLVERLAPLSAAVAASAELKNARRVLSNVREIAATQDPTMIGTMDTINKGWLWPNKIRLVGDGSLLERCDATEAAYEQALKDAIDHLVEAQANPQEAEVQA